MDDAGVDAGVPDAGFDAGGPVDSGVRDTGPRDTGPDVGFVAQLGPSQIDFGAQPVGCLGPAQEAVVQNLGVSTLEIRQISLGAGTGTSFMVEAPSLPFTLGPAASRRIPIRFAPRLENVATDELRVSYQDPTPLRIQLRGRGANMPLVTETTVVQGGPIDVLFVIDNGPGAGALQARLGNLVNEVIRGLAGFDYHLGVTTTDMSAVGAQGALQGTPVVIDPSNPQPINALAMRVQVGQASAQPARGLDAALAALTPPLSTGVNRGFLRPSTRLLVVLVSERSDASTVFPADFAQQLDRINGAAPQALNAITPLTMGCTLPSGGSGVVDLRTRAAVQESGGVTDDACGSTFTDAVSTLPGVAPVSVFPLGQRVVPGTVEVRVNGARVPEGQAWTFEPGPQRVVFRAGSEPEFGATIEIRYQARC